MTFQQLQYILEVQKTGSVSLAAKNLFVSSSSVSIALRALEKELGYPLFLRMQKGLIPTEQGKQVLDYADQLCRTHALLNAVGRESVHTLRISCTDQPPVADAYAQLLWEMKDRKNLRIENISYSGEDIYKKMVAHEIDLSLSTMLSFSLGHWEKRFRKGGLHQQILKTVPAVIKVGPGHRLYGAEKVHPYDLRNDSFIDDPHTSLLESNSFGGNLYVDPNRVIRITKPSIRKEVLQRGMGFVIGVMPPNESRGNLHCIPLVGAYFHFSAITNTQVPPQPEILRFLELAKQKLDEAYPEDHSEKAE